MTPPCCPDPGASLVATVPPMVQAERELWALHDKRDPNILVLLLSQKFRWVPAGDGGGAAPRAVARRP